MTRVVLDQGNSETPLDAGRRLALTQALLQNGYPVTLAGQEGGVAPVDDTDLLVLREGAADEDTQATEGGIPVRYRDVEGLEADGVIELVRETSQTPASGDWTPWFPVIDYDPLHQLHAVSLVLPLRRLRRRRGQADRGPRSAEVQDQLPGVLAGVPRGGDPLSRSTSTVRSTGTPSRPRTSNGRR